MFPMLHQRLVPHLHTVGGFLLKYIDPPLRLAVMVAVVVAAAHYASAMPLFFDEGTFGL